MVRPGQAVLARPTSSSVGSWLALAAILAVAGVALVGVPWSAALLVGLVVAGGAAADWRRSVGILVAILPFAGLPVFFLSARYGPLAKDVLIVLPLYVAFLVSRLRRGERVLPERDPVVTLAGVFSAVAVAYSLVSPSATVAAIGLKVWLFYLPLYVIGHAYVRDVDDVVRLLRRVALLALVPATVAFFEVLYFARTGGFGPLMHLYGRFSTIVVKQVGFGASIPRIPSTFTFAGSYYNFGLVALASALGYWGFRRSRRSGFLVVVLALATLASGERRSYFTVPILVAVAVGLMRSGMQTKLRAFLMGLAALMTLITLGVPVLGISGHLQEGVVSNIGAASQQFVPALDRGFLGHGTGSATNAAFRYSSLTPTAATTAEAWYTKALLELGYVGFGVAVVLVGTLLVYGYRRIQRLQLSARAVAAPIWALLFVTGLMLAKASELDWDPLDAYFWLFAGLLSGLAATTRTREPASIGKERAR